MALSIIVSLLSGFIAAYIFNLVNTHTSGNIPSISIPKSNKKHKADVVSRSEEILWQEEQRKKGML